MNEERILIGCVVGYMLKVLKSGKDILKFKDEFDSIRHGNYYDFINLIKGQIPEMVVYNKGQIEVNPKLKSDDIDFIGLLKAAPSLNIFFKECYQEYGDIKDNDIPDSIFYKVALFEISLRMHANNYGLLKKRERLVTVIKELGVLKKMTSDEIELIQKGRRFINMIKHYKGQFDTWEDGIEAFNRAYELKNEYGIKIS